MTSAAAVQVVRANALALLAENVILSSGWRRRAIAFGSGAVGALAMPPFAVFPAMIAPMSIAVWLIDGSAGKGEGRRAIAGLRMAFGAGWWMGFGYFVAGLWWLGAACLVDGTKFLWALPFSVLALPAALAFFPALGLALARLLWLHGPLRVLALAVGLGLAEWMRGIVLTGFPWNDLGMTLGANLVLAQSASIVGLHGLTFLAIAIFAAPATLWSTDERRMLPWPTVLAAGALMVIAGYGVVRLRAPPSETVAGAKLRIIQPNVSQGDSFAPEHKDAILRRYFELSARDANGRSDGALGVTHLIWPESAFPFILSRDAGAIGDIADFLSHGAVLVTGAARLDKDADGDPVFFNSIEVLDRRGLSRERYDKHHLVPFGEYLPFERWLAWAGITQFIQFPGGFTAGSGPRALHVPGLPVATPLICYEAIFPTEIGDAFSGARRPAWLLNLTDDAWFGLTPGPYQHYAQARLRAIELGLPLVRAANSGKSAVFDGLGREIAGAPLGVEAVLDFALPRPLSPTWQSRLGSLGAGLLALAMLSICLIARRRP